MNGSKSPEHPDDEGRPPTLAEARALAHPLRIRILRLCLDESRTNRQLASALGAHPATVLHHVRTLLNTGFLAEEPWRQGPRGSVEKPYLSTRKSWRLEGGLDLRTNTSRRAVFEAVSAEIGEGGPDSIVEGTRLATRLRPEELDELVRRIRELVDEYSAADSPDGDPFAMFLVLHRRQKEPSPDQDIPSGQQTRAEITYEAGCDQGEGVAELIQFACLGTVGRGQSSWVTLTSGHPAA